ncbi:MAG: cob(I)yrinic acid a,c-diamide adenosyltransferase [Candidatus Wildermuthbacteria bacterium]|nr:cob(I)yrinic acid a,c-diamide adenosyltransferase [Candidatus Wildermuthbacteria bacterium]
MGLFYTGRGDKGKSSIGKKKIPKDHPALVALGDLDELNSLLGLVRAAAKRKALRQKIQTVQQNLFTIQANVAWNLYPKFKAPPFSEEKVRMMEKAIETMETAIRPKRGFVVAGADEIAAWLDYARTVARRAERSTFVFLKQKKISPSLLTYLNRLSSYLYALARFEAHKAKIKESNPTYR